MLKKILYIVSFVMVPALFCVCIVGVCKSVTAPYAESFHNIMTALTVTDADRLSDVNQDYTVWSDKTVNVNTNPQDQAVPESINKADITFPKYGQSYGRISCDTIELEATIYLGDDLSILEKGVGQYIGSFYPGQNRVILIKGNEKSYFKNLASMKVGASVWLQTEYGLYEYRVTAVEEESKEPYQFGEQEEKLVLKAVSLDEKTENKKKTSLYVIGTRISGPVMKE